MNTLAPRSRPPKPATVRFSPPSEGGAPDGVSISLLSHPDDQAGDAAEFAYQHIQRRIRDARESIEVHMYVWRADAVGHLIGEALLSAADRGVRVRILKDSGAALFETQESNRKPFFPTERPFFKRIMHQLIGWTLPDSFRNDDWNQSLGRALSSHPNVSFEWVSPTHTKYYCIDERFLITGSLNLEDRHRGYHDVMVEVTGEKAVRAFRAAQSDPLLEERVGTLQILLNDPPEDVFGIKDAAISMIEKAQDSIHIEMAYIGDEDITRALVDAAGRGVRLSILFSAEANIGNDINFHTLRHLMIHSGIEVRLSDKMIHSKLMSVDGRSVLMGSANFSIFSMQRAGELCLRIDDDDVFIGQMHAVLAERWRLGRPVNSVGELPRHRRLLAALQQWHQRMSTHR